MELWWPIATKVLAVFAMMGCGVFARVVGWLSAESDRSLMKLTVSILLPSLFFHRILTDERLNQASEVYLPPLVGFGTTLLGFVVAGLVASFMGKWIDLPSQSHRRAFTLCTGMYNYGYVPLPIALAIFPGAVTTLIVHNVGVEIALWTLGLLIISGHLGRDWWKHVLNPPVIAIGTALFLKFVGVRHYVPGFVIEASHDLGVCGIPLGLILSGATIYDLFRQASWLKHWRSFATATLIRVVLLPAVFLLMAKYLPLREELKIVILLQAAMPAATFPIVMTRLYGGDTPTAFRIVVGTTILSVVTIPLWIMAGAWYLGIKL